MRIFLSLIFLVSIGFNGIAQGITIKPEKPSSSEIYEDIQSLNFLGTVLYVAAHPDDENTAMISYFNNKVHARAIYLSMTRGDGGQNLIGPELGPLLGLIRTQELLAARRTDGGEQRFTRANDFGYSKHPDETLKIWEKEKVLGDVVWAMRRLKPDVVINRFDHRSPGSTHGHHTSSAMLSVEAFELAGDPNAYPKQLEYASTWQPKRQFFNTSWWFYGSREKFEQADKSNLVSIDVGTFYPGYGLSNTEISALSRSQHKSQGFGNTGSRGADISYLELLKGDYPDSGNLFEGIDTSWNRVEGGAEIGKILNQVQQNFDFKNPASSLPQLIQAYNRIQQLKDDHWREIKTSEIKDIIQACAGLYLEAATDMPSATAGQEIKVQLEAVNRSDAAVKLKSVSIQPENTSVSASKTLENNKVWTGETTINLATSSDLTTPYWLREPGSLGMYNVQDQQLIGLPETPVAHSAKFDVEISGTSIAFEKPLIYKFNDRVDGEVYQPFEILPPVSVGLTDDVMIFATAEPKKIPVTVTGHTVDFSGKLILERPDGWAVSPENADITLAEKGDSQTVIFTVTPPNAQHTGTLTPVVTANGEKYDRKLVTIDYSHIPKQTVLLPASAKVVRLDIQRRGEYIGYIAGAGDVVPENLEQIGYQVAMIDPASITPELLSQFDAVVMGIRAYNTVDELQRQQPKILNYVKNGGTVIVQYNTSGRWTDTQVGAPYPLTISRDRVTDENSEVRILAQDNPVLNFPNKITQADFDGWAQERGLYFPDKWADEYTPVLSMNDEGETAKDGSLLVAKYGKGHYIYTGLSFFREFPAGVSGAFRLFANMLSIGKQDTENVKG